MQVGRPLLGHLSCLASANFGMKEKKYQKEGIAHPCQHLLSPKFLILAFLSGVWWNLRIVLICVSLMTKDVVHFF